MRLSGVYILPSAIFLLSVIWQWSWNFRNMAFLLGNLLQLFLASCVMVDEDGWIFWYSAVCVANVMCSFSSMIFTFVFISWKVKSHILTQFQSNGHFQMWVTQQLDTILLVNFGRRHFRMVSNTPYKLYMQQKVHLKLYEVAASILQVTIKLSETKKNWTILVYLTHKFALNFTSPKLMFASMFTWMFGKHDFNHILLICLLNFRYIQLV